MKTLTGLLCVVGLVLPSVVYAQQVFFVTDANIPVNKLTAAGAQVCEFEDKLLVLADKQQMAISLTNIDVPLGTEVNSRLTKPVIAHRRGIDTPLARFSKRMVVLFEDGPITIFQTLPSVLKRIMDEQSNHFQIMSFDENPRLHISASRAFDKITADDAKSEKRAVLGDKVDIIRIMDHIQCLQDFKTRYTYEPSFLESANWALKRFEAMGYDVELVEYKDSDRPQFNVVAKSKSATADDFYYVVGAHLDSISENPRVHAPGADDNGSGAAGTLEMARVFAGTKFEKNIQFVLFAGEEVGLRGSTAYVRKFLAENDKDKIRGAVILDMIGFDHKGPVSGLLETKIAYKEFIKVFSDEAAVFGSPEISVSFSPFGSDHMPFINNKIPAFLFIETEYDDNPNYHRTTDIIDYVNGELVEAIIKISVQGLEKLLSTP